MKAFLKLVAIEHSVFALPFAYLAALVAMQRDGGGCAGSICCSSRSRWCPGATFAMAANRILDRRIDARNPRTANRELVTGAVSVRTAWIGAVVSLVVLFVAAGLLNPLCLLLSPLAVIPLVVYPYAKRFTDFPHAILALAQAVAPVGAWLAVTGTFAGSGPVWVLGRRRRAVDRRLRPHLRLPGRRGRPRDRGALARRPGSVCGAALHASTVTHVVTFALFVWFGALVGLGWLWWIGLALTAAAFAYQHVVVTPERPVPGQPGVLHRQRLRRHRPVRVRPPRPGDPARPEGLAGLYRPGTCLVHARNRSNRSPG